MAMKLVLFYSQEQGEEVIGFKILSSKDATKFRKATKLLEDNGNSYSFGGDQYQWNLENFEFKSVSNAEIKVLNSIFSMDYDNGFSRTVGFFPDAIEYAYEEGLIDQNGKPQNDDYDQQYDDQDY